jgi:CelD/BcsL family acetyltransferase involved in cellulose biosynthesis
MENRLVGILPVRAEKGAFLKIPARKISFLSNAYCNHNDLIVDPRCEIPELLAEALPLLEKHVGPWDLMEIDEALADSPRLNGFEGVCRRLGYDVRRRYISKSPYIPLGADFETVYRALRSGDARRRIRRLEERLRERKGFLIRHYRKQEEVAEAMETVIRVERDSWKAANGTDIASHPNQVSFYMRFAELAASRGWLWIVVAAADEGPMAYEYNLCLGRRCFHLKGSYGETYKDLSPSKVLKKEALKFLCDAGFDEYDYTGQEQEHKREWSEKARDHQFWLVFNGTLHGRFLAKAADLSSKLKSDDGKAT